MNSFDKLKQEGKAVLNMMPKIQVFRDTLYKCRSLRDPNYTEAKYYDMDTVNQLAEAHVDQESHATIWVSPDDSLSAALKMKQEQGTSEVLVLNFANAVSAGGGVEFGANAQEEDLCRTSSLYPSLISQEGKQYYAYNKSHQLDKKGSDTAIYSPHVYIMKDRDYQDIDPVEVSVVTMAAPVRRRKDTSYDVMDQRIFKLLCIAEDAGHKNLVLGAWGCGVFGNDPAAVAGLFRQNLEKFGSFERVVFAIIPNGSRVPNNYSCFLEEFK